MLSLFGVTSAIVKIKSEQARVEVSWMLVILSPGPSECRDKFAPKRDSQKGAWLWPARLPDCRLAFLRRRRDGISIFAADVRLVCCIAFRSGLHFRT